MNTIIVFGDQLNTAIGAMREADRSEHRILLVESEQLLAKGRHVQRRHLVLTAMRRFGDELAGKGFAVDRRRAPTLRRGIEDHVDSHSPDRLIATEPNSRRARRLLEDLGVDLVRSNQFLCHYDEFADWAESRATLKMEDFYRWTRTRLGYLMDGDEPVTGRWNYDSENRQPPPDDTGIFADPSRSNLDEIDGEVLDSIPPGHGAEPIGLWATSRRAALARLRHFIDHELATFGPYEDAMTRRSWHLSHSVLSPYLNLGLLLPGEVVEAAIAKYEEGSAPIASVEGFVRQVIGWREYVWGLYWLWPDHIESNHLNHRRHVPPLLEGDAETDMVCVGTAVQGLHDRAYVHHIQRLMVLSNFANLYGIHPQRLMEWMWNNYIDGAEWVMIPNVMGMALWADGGRMATKPYVSGGAYINRMSDYCGDCRFDPKKRTGDDACPFTTLYWDFLARHRETLAGNHRMRRTLANLDRLKDLDDVRDRAATVTRAIRDGRL